MIRPTFATLSLAVLSFTVCASVQFDAQLAGFQAIESPTVQTLNGSYVGKRIPTFEQDAFLGIPYAQPPLGDLRFRRPQSLDASWNGSRVAKEFGHSCYQNPSGEDMSEDCLTLNIIRPSNLNSSRPLPVLILIYGGGFTYGASRDPLYNLSSLISLSENMGQPILGVTFNYRLGVWGFFSSPETFAERSTNAGLMDQRMAFAWVRENIAAFGGDPKRITIWGYSAGAQSIGLHLHSFAGRNDGLYHAAIMESGGPVGTALQELPFYRESSQKLLESTGCAQAADKLLCLRSVPAHDLYAKAPKQVWNPIVDGDFLTAYPSELSSRGQFVKIPIITGTNTDEGTSFSGPRTLDSDAALASWLKTWRSYNLSRSSIEKLIKLYEAYDAPPYHIPPQVRLKGTGSHWRNSAAIGGDIVMAAQRRKVSQSWTRAGSRVWSFRFDTPVWNATQADGSRHNIEVPFTLGAGGTDLGPLPQFEHYRRLSRAIGRAYVKFVNGRFQDDERASPETESVPDDLPYWPEYGRKAANMVLNANGSFVEADDWRVEGIDLINSISKELLA